MANFTPQEIEEILQQFFDVTGKRQYIGARYVPIFGRKDESSIEWDNSKPYEPLTIVLYLGNSYTSRTYVPVGVGIDDTYYWALTGNYNAQVESYRQDVARISAILPSSNFDAEHTVYDYIEDLLLRTPTNKIYLNKSQAIADSNIQENDKIIVLMDDNNAINPIAYTIVSSVPTTNFAGIFTLNNGLYAFILSYSKKQRPKPISLATVSAVTRVADSYISRGSEFSYGAMEPWNPTIKKINCSTFSMLVCMGINYESSPYEGVTRWAVGTGGYGYDIYNGIFPSSAAERISGSAALAQWAAANGFGFVPLPDFSDIMAGDVVFFRNADGTHSQGWLNIAHCEVMIAPSNNTIFETHTTNHVTFISANAGYETGLTIRYTERNLYNQEATQIPVYVMRLPLELSYVPNNIGYPSVYGGNSTTPYFCQSRPKIPVNREANSLIHISGEFKATSDVARIKVYLSNAQTTQVSEIGAEVSSNWRTFSFAIVASSPANYNVVGVDCVLRNITYCVNSLVTTLSDRGNIVIPSSISDIDSLMKYLVNTIEIAPGIYEIRVNTGVTTIGNGVFTFIYTGAYNIGGAGLLYPNNIPTAGNDKVFCFAIRYDTINNLYILSKAYRCNITEFEE